MNNNSEARHLIDGVSVFCAFDEVVEIDKLKENPRNPNTHPSVQIDLLAQIIKKTGWRAPITVSNLSGFIVKGHGRLQAAKAAGFKHCPVEYQNFIDEEEEMAALLADNKLAELAEIDVEKLTEIFKDYEFEDLSLTGYSQEEFDELVEVFEEAELLGDPDEVPEEVETRCKLGDIWQLGNHRLMCGDSTSRSDIEQLMNGDKADMAFTDPPWNVNYGAIKEGNPQGYKPRTILNDFMGTEDFKEFMFKAFSSLNFAQKDGAMTYVVMSAQEWGNMMLTLAQNDYHWSSTIIWNKDSLVLSRKDYHTKYEPIWYGWKEGTRLCPLEDRKQSDVWDIARPKKSEEHPTMKPVELVEKAINNSSKPGDVVIDLFGGSGTTLIASEQTKRRCRMMELDPKYCDVIITRWETLTGKKAVLCT
jgi:DNA modification methylase